MDGDKVDLEFENYNLVNTLFSKGSEDLQILRERAAYKKEIRKAAEAAVESGWKGLEKLKKTVASGDDEAKQINDRLQNLRHVEQNIQLELEPLIVSGKNLENSLKTNADETNQVCDMFSYKMFELAKAHMSH
ncbi:hypothetical protein HDE_08596 [Halotydeus destructor]|nr:hypothetical protein HDE_08596 [Halotydeus destructor]